ncbi:helix-turn-helix domain-containing protein [Amphibacillus cookii]|uniref:helix-turn-helix domain-containing protein n=1 Tax=Amphibacillus cookii TaxID=767787 RepID=UPI001957FD2D|nr:helix-turn-helix transcriptional regulator [Amphibacillus cookii]MBM7540887.1 transcriptional regulator with XRE-family HTH domain [Amphibacillus cookii]
MSEGIGHKIKYFRTKANMTQEELAKGIVSVSYLSKIERNSADPNPDAIEKICQRLEIQPERVLDHNINNLVYQWFNQLLDENIIRAHETYQRIEEEIEKVIDADLYWLVELHTLFYFILTNQLNYAKRKYAFLEQDRSHFNEIEHYYWLKFSGYYNYSNLAYEDAFQFYLRAEKMMPEELVNNQQEKHDLYFQISCTATRLYYTYHSTVYVKRALDYYRNTYQLKRCAESHIILGVAYKRMNEVNEALTNFELACKIATELKEHDVLVRCNQAMGELYSDMQLTDQAIHYYKHCYELSKHSFTEAELNAISGLFKAYYNCGDIEQAKQWHKVARELVNHELTISQPLNYEISIYYYLIYGFDQGFEVLMEKEILPFFKKRKLYLSYAYYLQMTGDYYYQIRKYKVSANYYREANEALNQLRIRDNN